jgi:hypothetical protein
MLTAQYFSSLHILSFGKSYLRHIDLKRDISLKKQNIAMLFHRCEISLKYFLICFLHIEENIEEHRILEPVVKNGPIS